MSHAPELSSLNESGVAEERQREAALRETARLYGKALLERQGQRESNARTYPRRIPIAICRAQGIYVEDVEGRVYIDCLAGAGALALGHSHPVVVDAVQRALSESLPWQTLDLMTPVKDRFIEDLFASLPNEFVQNARIQFCSPSGADAIEAALKLVKIATGRRTVLCFRGAYHGMTQGALGITGELVAKEGVAGLMTEVQFLPYPYSYRCPFGLGGEAGCEAGIRYIETLLDDPNSGVASPAALVLEVVQGEGGVVPAPDGWLRALRRITYQRGIPLVIDEVQTGLGRTGRMYAFEHAEIIPDVLVLSKAIGGGLPLSVVVYSAALDQWPPGAHAGTFRGNQLAMVAGSATLQYIQAQRLWEHSEAMGRRLMAALSELMPATRSLGEMRGRGLMIGVEVVDKDKTDAREPHLPYCPEMARRIQQEALARGLILECGGRFGSVVRFLPPLIVTLAQIDEIAARFADAVWAAE